MEADSHLQPNKLRRIKAARLLVDTKQSYRSIAEVTGVEPRTLAYWAQQIRLGQLDSVISPKRKRGGRRAALSMQVQNILRTKLRADPRSPARAIQLWLKSYHRVELSPQSLNYWIMKLLGKKRERRRKGAKTDVITGSDSAPKLTKGA
jgi:hypothetical protein